MRVVKFVKVEKRSLRKEVALLDADYKPFRAKQGNVYAKDVKEGLKWRS